MIFSEVKISNSSIFSVFYTLKLTLSAKINGSTRKLVKFWESKRPQTILLSFFIVPQKMIWKLKGKSVFFQCIFLNSLNNAPFTMLSIVFCLQQYINLRQEFKKCTDFREKLHPIILYIVISLILQYLVTFCQFLAITLY